MTDEKTADWQRPPFEEGNDAAVTHGARSPRKVEAIARQVNDELLDRYEWIADFPETLTALARAEGVTRLLFADLATHGIYDKRGQFKASVIARYQSAENLGAKLRASLGMTPASEAEVARDRAAATASTVDVVGELLKQGRATRALQDLPAAAIGPVNEPTSHDGEAS
jgi:hypothetical protein